MTTTLMGRNIIPFLMQLIYSGMKVPRPHLCQLYRQGKISMKDFGEKVVPVRPTRFYRQK